MLPVGFWNSTRGQGIPWQGNYSSWLTQKQNRLKTEEKVEGERIKNLGARTGMD